MRRKEHKQTTVNVMTMKTRQSECTLTSHGTTQKQVDRFRYLPMITADGKHNSEAARRNILVKAASHQSKTFCVSYPSSWMSDSECVYVTYCPHCGMPVNHGLSTKAELILQWIEESEREELPKVGGNRVDLDPPQSFNEGKTLLQQSMQMNWREENGNYRSKHDSIQ